jgi:hypothetical protein
LKTPWNAEGLLSGHETAAVGDLHVLLAMVTGTVVNGSRSRKRGLGLGAVRRYQVLLEHPASDCAAPAQPVPINGCTQPIYQRNGSFVGRLVSYLRST